MKCPHCNQEHPEGTKFCPETGKRMMLCCRNSECENFGEYVIPSNYKFCPECGVDLHAIVDCQSKDNAIIESLPEKKYKIVLVSADEKIITEIDKITGTDVSRNIEGGGIKKLRIMLGKKIDFKEYFPYTLYNGKAVAESKALTLKNQLETIGAKVELVRLSSSTVEDFRRGHISVSNIVLGKTGLQELMTKKYKAESEECLEYWTEDIVKFSFEASEKTHAEVLYLNRDLDSSSVADIQREFGEMFVNPSDANFSFVENPSRVVNTLETCFDELPCFAEMGVDDSVFSINDGDEDRPADEVETIINDIFISNGWVRIDNFLKPENLFSKDELKATYRCSTTGKAGNNVFMMLFVSSERNFDGWVSCRVVFAIDLIK